MSLREEQCKKVFRILDDVLANRPTERDSLIVAVRKAFKALAEPSQVSKDIARIVENEQDMRVIGHGRIKGRWIEHDDGLVACECSVCHEKYNLYEEDVFGRNFCPNCGADMREVTE